MTLGSDNNHGEPAGRRQWLVVIKGCSLVGSILYFNPQGIMEEVKDLGNIVDMRDMFEVLGSK